MNELIGSRMESIRHLRPETAFEHCYQEIEADWENLSPLARLMYAKMRSALEDRSYLDKLGL